MPSRVDTWHKGPLGRDPKGKLAQKAAPPTILPPQRADGQECSRPTPERLPVVATKPLPARAPLSSRACASGERREAAGHTGPASGWIPTCFHCVAGPNTQRPTATTQRPDVVGGSKASLAVHSRYVVQIKTKQNKPTEKHCSAQSTSDENATAPNKQPPLVPTPTAPQKEGSRQGPWLWLSARPWPWPGLEATRGRGARSRRPSVALGKVRFVLRAHLPGRGGGDTTGSLGAEGIGVGVRPCAWGHAWYHHSGRLPSPPLGDTPENILKTSPPHSHNFQIGFQTEQIKSDSQSQRPCSWLPGCSRHPRPLGGVWAAACGRQGSPQAQGAHTLCFVSSPKKKKKKRLGTSQGGQRGAPPTPTSWSPGHQ